MERFSNFWASVSKLSIGRNVSDETSKVIVSAMKKYASIETTPTIS